MKMLYAMVSSMNTYDAYCRRYVATVCTYDTVYCMYYCCGIQYRLYIQTAVPGQYVLLVVTGSKGRTVHSTYGRTNVAHLVATIPPSHNSKTTHNNKSRFILSTTSKEAQQIK